ncbi:hypothetical protein ACLOJK_013712 [Asimina triloba]
MKNDNSIRPPQIERQKLIGVQSVTADQPPQIRDLTASEKLISPDLDCSIITASKNPSNEPLLPQIALLSDRAPLKKKLLAGEEEEFADLHCERPPKLVLSVGHYRLGKKMEYVDTVLQRCMRFGAHSRTFWCSNGKFIHVITQDLHLGTTPPIILTCDVLFRNE